MGQILPRIAVNLEGFLNSESSQPSELPRFNWDTFIDKSSNFETKETHVFKYLHDHFEVYKKQNRGYFILNTKNRKIIFDTHFDPHTETEIILKIKDYQKSLIKNGN